MNWFGLTCSLLILVGALALAVYRNWPRHRNGKLYSVEEFNEFMDNFPPPKGLSQRAQWIVTGAFATAAMIGIALTSRGSKSDIDFHD